MQYHALIDDLYHEILCIEGDESGAVIKLRSPFATCIAKSRGSEITFGNRPRAGTAKRVSQELLLINTHPLTSFLTNPQRARGLFIDRAAYHTQMAEHQLLRLTPRALASNEPCVSPLLTWKAADILNPYHLILGLKNGYGVPLSGNAAWVFI
jgi:hypothetical protein